MYFVDTVRNNAENMELADAIDTAIDDCIGKNILPEFFRTRRNEVMKVMTMDYTWERREEIIRREEREEGREEGQIQMLDKIANALKLVREKNYCTQKELMDAGCDEEVSNFVLELIKGEKQ
jgi:hypothetical protein